MYDIKLAKGEKIILISDNSIINNNNYTTIITNKRLLILDYPNQYHNSQEELRILNRINYIKMKEIIFESPLDDIKYIKENKITLKNNDIILIQDNDIINKLKEKENEKNTK